MGIDGFKKWVSWSDMQCWSPVTLHVSMLIDYEWPEGKTSSNPFGHDHTTKTLAFYIACKKDNFWGMEKNAFAKNDFLGWVGQTRNLGSRMFFHISIPSNHSKCPVINCPGTRLMLGGSFWHMKFFTRIVFTLAIMIFLDFGRLDFRCHETIANSLCKRIEFSTLVEKAGFINFSTNFLARGRGWGGGIRPPFFEGVKNDPFFLQAHPPTHTHTYTRARTYTHAWIYKPQYTFKLPSIPCIRVHIHHIHLFLW